MTYLDFLTKIIDDGIAAARADYKDDAEKREGAIAGFEACRDKTPPELLQALEAARAATAAAYRTQDLTYWATRCFEAEVEWVCNCVSAMLFNERKPIIVPPTARGVLKAAEVLGILDRAAGKASSAE